MGVDLNEAMLGVARRVRPDIEFRQGDAARLPFADESFDAVLSQMALMFFPDRAAAVQEMARVTSPGGAVAVLVPAHSSTSWPSPGSPTSPFATPATRPGRCSAPTSCAAISTSSPRWSSPAGLQVTTARTEVGTYRAPSVDAFVTTEVESTPLVQRISPDVYARIRTGAHDVLAPFTTADGRVEAPFESNLVVARRV